MPVAEFCKDPRNEEVCNKEPEPDEGGPHGEYDADGDEEKKWCCHAMTAPCLACQLGMPVAEFCKDPRNEEVCTPVGGYGGGGGGYAAFVQDSASEEDTLKAD